MSETISLKVPEKWEQLSRKQVLYVAKLFLARLTENEFLTRAFCRFSGLRPVGFDRLTNCHLFSLKGNPGRIHYNEMFWFIKSQNYLFNITLTTNLLPWFRIGILRWFGPSNKCYNLTLNEYLHAETAVYGFEVTKRFCYIDRLCAILYRPAGRGAHPGDRRRSFNDFTYTKHARWFRLLPRYKRYAVLLFYTGCRQAIVAAFPHIFGKGSTSAPANPAFEIQRMVRVLNDGDVTRNKSILNTPVWEALAQLNDMAEAVKRQNKNANGKV